jgi:hypothetical protein
MPVLTSYFYILSSDLYNGLEKHAFQDYISDRTSILRRNSMEIQNISGVDSVPSGFSVKSEIPTEQANDQRETESRAERVPEPEKGQSIDTYA